MNRKSLGLRQLPDHSPPNERPDSASDVLTALESIDLTLSAISASAAIEKENNVFDSLAGGVFVGRQVEMGQLKAALG